jgi:hypothetical protein
MTCGHQAEEVVKVSVLQRLVANHESSSQHKLLLDSWRYLTGNGKRQILFRRQIYTTYTSTVLSTQKKVVALLHPKKNKSAKYGKPPGNKIRYSEASLPYYIHQKLDIQHSNRKWDKENKKDLKVCPHVVDRLSRVDRESILSWQYGRFSHHRSMSIDYDWTHLYVSP